MNNLLKIDLMSKDVSIGTIALISIVGILGAIILFFMIKICINHEKNTDKPSFSWIKMIIIAIGPALFSAKGILNIDIEYKISIVITIISVIICFLWNMFTYGLIYGIIYTVIQSLAGVIAGISVIAVVAVILVAAFVGASDTGGKTGSSSNEVYDIGTNNIYRLERTSGGDYYIMKNGIRTILRKGDFGDFIDDNHNRYKFSAG